MGGSLNLPFISELQLLSVGVFYRPLFKCPNVIFVAETRN